MLDLPKLQLDIKKDTQIKMYATASGRIQCKYPNIQNIPRDYQESESEWLWQQCREKERDGGHKRCDGCHERFKCWTAGEPSNIDTKHEFVTGIEQLQQSMKAQVITFDEAQEAFKSLCDMMTIRYDSLG